MKAINVWSYIKIGTGFRYLQEATKGRPLHGESFVLENIKRFLDTLETLEMHVTSRASKKLKVFYEKLSKKGEAAVLTSHDAEEMRELVKEVRGTFSAEAQGIYTYIVTEKRLSTEKLINDLKELFSPGTFSHLSDVAQYDFKEAGRCIAFERSTAASFHLLRGIEAILRQYFRHFLHEEKEDASWGHMVYTLKKTRDLKTDLDTLKHLDHIRSAFRNPTQHPDKIYDIHEAQDLFFLAIDVTNRMIAEIKR